MALTWTESSTDKITITNPLTLGAGSEFTTIYWVRQASTPVNGAGTGKTGVDAFVYFNNWFADVPRGTQSANNIFASNATLFPTLNAWVYLAITYSETNGLTAYRGTLTAAPTALTPLSSRVGSGDTTANTSDFYLGNRSAAGSNAPDHTYGFFALYDSEMTLGEVRAQWMNPTVIKSGCRVLYNIGFSGTTTQIDLSGNKNNGACTGLVNADHIPFKQPYGADAVFNSPAEPVVNPLEWYLNFVQV